MSRVRTGWRLAKASWNLLRSDRTLVVFPLLSTVAIVAALAITLTPGLVLEAALDAEWLVLPFMLVGGYAATFLAVHFNVALVGAARLAMDGRDVGPGAALKRSASLVRERWGEGLVGYTAINTAVLVVGAVPVVLLAGAIDPAFDVGKVAGAVVLFATIVAFIAACTLGSALGMLFRTELYRYSTQGGLSGGFAQADVAAAFGPPKPGTG